MDYEEKRVGDVLKECLKDMGLGSALQLSEIERMWEEIVGDRISRRAKPIRIEGDRLIISTVAPPWSNEVSLMRDEIKERILKMTGIKLGEILVRTERR